MGTDIKEEIEPSRLLGGLLFCDAVPPDTKRANASWLLTFNPFVLILLSIIATIDNIIVVNLQLVRYDD
jgi:hypothetical protein